MNKELQLRIEKEINQLLTKIDGIPNELIPKVNIYNDLAYHYIEIDSKGTIYLVIREGGIEYERIIYNDLYLLLKEVFTRLSFELALRYELENRKNNLDYSFKKIESLQRDYLKKFNKNW